MHLLKLYRQISTLTIRLLLASAASVICLSSLSSQAEFLPLHVWQGLLPQPASTDLSIIIHTERGFIAAGNDYALFGSTDGRSWNTIGNMLQADPLDASIKPFSDISMFDGTFYVMDSARKTYTSKDGLQWITRTNPLPISARGYATFNGRLILGGLNILTSTNGLDWTRASTNSAFSMANDSNKMVSLTSKGKLLLTTNAVDWMDITPSASDWPSITSIARIGDLWIAAGKNETVFISTNGLDWNLGSTPSAGGETLDARSLIQLQNSFWIAGKTAWWKLQPNEQKFIRTDVPVDPTHPAIASDTQTAVRVGAAGSIQYSTNMVDWTTAGKPRIRYKYQNIFHQAGYTFANSYRSASDSDWITEVSTNKVDWSPVPFPAGFRAHSLTYGQDLHVALGLASNRTTILISTNINEWSAASISNAPVLIRVFYQKGMFFAFSTGRPHYISQNGRDWIRTTNNALPFQTVSLTLFKNRHYAGHSAGQITCSEDGQNWTLSRGRFGDSPALLSSSPNILLANIGSAALVSSDGEHWISNTIPYLGSAYQLTYGNGYFALFSGSGTLRYSRDGKDWIRTKFTSETPSGLVFANGSFLLCTESGSVLESSPLHFLDWNTPIPDSALLFGSTGSVYTIESTVKVEESIRWRNLSTVTLTNSPQLIPITPPTSPGAVLIRSKSP